MMWLCALCRADQVRWGKSSICRACRARIVSAGKRWCSRGRHVVQPSLFLARRGVCYDCRAADRREYRRKHRGAIPVGWLRSRELAARIGVTDRTIRRWITHQWPAPACRVGRFYYIKPLPNYPPPPDRRRR